jgi:periplasmic divalent cation tolerance protein
MVAGTMSEASEVLIVYCTVPDVETGERIARHLVEYGLAACVNIVAGVTSIYRWQGRVESDSEALMVIKAPAQAYRRLESAICSQHPYELPEIIAVPVSDGLAGYLNWIATNHNEAP